MVPSVRRRRHLRGVETFGLRQKDVTLTHSILGRDLGEWALIVYLAQLGEAGAFRHVLSPTIGRFKVIEGTSRALVNVTISWLELPKWADPGQYLTVKPDWILAWILWQSHLLKLLSCKGALLVYFIPNFPHCFLQEFIRVRFCFFTLTLVDILRNASLLRQTDQLLIINRHLLRGFALLPFILADKLFDHANFVEGKRLRALNSEI